MVKLLSAKTFAGKMFRSVGLMFLTILLMGQSCSQGDYKYAQRVYPAKRCNQSETNCPATVTTRYCSGCGGRTANNVPKAQIYSETFRRDFCWPLGVTYAAGGPVYQCRYREGGGVAKIGTCGGCNVR